VIAAERKDICVVKRDGSELVRLTDDAAEDQEPAWSPDGALIAFTTTRFTGREDVAVMASTGGQVTRLAAGIGPSWSGDGSRLVFTIPGLGLATIRRDGSGFQLISHQAEYAPAWRP
jgi:Tol biopolymer transport system component